MGRWSKKRAKTCQRSLWTPQGKLKITTYTCLSAVNNFGSILPRYYSKNFNLPLSLDFSLAAVTDKQSDRSLSWTLTAPMRCTYSNWTELVRSVHNLRYFDFESGLIHVDFNCISKFNGGKWSWKWIIFLLGQVKIHSVFYLK